MMAIITGDKAMPHLMPHYKLSVEQYLRVPLNT